MLVFAMGGKQTLANDDRRAVFGCYLERPPRERLPATDVSAPTKKPFPLRYFNLAAYQSR